MSKKFLFRSAAASAALMLLMGMARAVTIETVPVGNPGNADDTRYHNPGCGGVDYEYTIGKYEVTNAEYTEFLNNVNPDGSDPYNLYNGRMGSDNRGGITYTAGNPGGANRQLFEHPGLTDAETIDPIGILPGCTISPYTFSCGAQFSP